MAKVLVVDDSLSVRKVVERALATRRIEAVTVASGAEAVDRIEREEPDAVVCDVVMPDRDGWQICAFVKGHARLSGTPVLLMTGVLDDAVRARAREVGADDILAKPFGADDLLRRLEGLIPATPREGAAAILAQLGAVDGVQWTVLADRDGFVLEAAAPADVAVEAVAALGAGIVGSWEALGSELGRGEPIAAMLEYERGLVVVHAVAASAILVIGVGGPAALGRVRYLVKKALPELARSV